MTAWNTRQVSALRGVTVRAIAHSVARGGAPRPDVWPPEPGKPMEWDDTRAEVAAWLTPPHSLARHAEVATARHGSHAAARRAAGLTKRTWLRVRRAEGWSHWDTAMAVIRAAQSTAEQ